MSSKWLTSYVSVISEIALEKYHWLYTLVKVKGRATF